MAKYYYNGVLLPEIPADVLASYPYCWIRKNTTSGNYDLFFSTEAFYVVDSDSISGSGISKPWYIVQMASVESIAAWEYSKETTANLAFDSNRTILWSNHDIPNGSATSSTIYFYGSEPVPENEAKPRGLEYLTVVDIYPGSEKIYYSVDDQTINYVVPVRKYSTYTVTMEEVGNRLRAVYCNVDPATITTDISATSIVYNPSFSVGYTFTYFAQEDGWMVVYVSNAGERPKISIVTNGAGGDGAPLYDRKYLVRSGPTIYTITDGALSTLTETEITANLFQTYGMNEAPNNSLLITLTNPELLYWQDSEEDLPVLKVKIKGTPPLPQTMITQPYEIPTSGIKYAEINATEDILFSISFDRGQSWLYYVADGKDWIESADTTIGMTAVEMMAIPQDMWYSVSGTATQYQIRFALPTVDSKVTSIIIHYLDS